MSDFFDLSEVSHPPTTSQSMSDKYLRELDEAGDPLEFDPEFEVARPSPRPFKLLKILILSGLVILLLRLFYLQVLSGNQYLADAEENRLRLNPILAPRGLIMDRGGEVLAKNVPSWQIAIIPIDWFRLHPDSAERDKILISLGIDPRIDELMVSENLNASFAPLLTERELNREEFLSLAPKINKFPGLVILETPVREYPYQEIVSHILGYLGRINKEEYQAKKDQSYFFNDFLGKEGIEYTYEEYLRGQVGEEVVEVDSRGKPKKTTIKQEPKPGLNVVLTIDIGLQQKLYERLLEQTIKAGVSKASAVALDPRDGSVLALVNIPSFDNNLFSRGISSQDYQNLLSDENRPLFNRAIAGTFPPGSSIKPLIGAAALEEKVVKPNQKINCAGGLVYHGFGGTTWVFADPYVHGSIGLKRAIAVSCNTWFYILGGGHPDYGIKGLGIDRIQKYAHKFGLGKILGIDLPGEAQGLVPNVAWKEENKGEKWYIGDTYNASIGQGDMAVTPLQLAGYVSVIANGGTLWKPHLLDQAIDNKSGYKVEYNPQVISRDFISPQNLRIIQEGMRQTVTEGSGRRLAGLPFTSAGKTGTAQCAGCGEKTHSWYVSFAPYEDPEIVLVVLVEEAGGGHEHAVPVTKDVLDWYFQNN